jgi:azurin/glucose/arabinose dehydrogenase
MTFVGACQRAAEPCNTEEECYPIVSVPVPAGIELEVGGMTVLPDGAIAVSTRRGDVWIIEDVYDALARPTYRRYARGLHEPLGLAYRDGVFYAAQRGELTRLLDTDLDGLADRYETVVEWPLTGNYHEYSYGPLLLPNSDFFVTLNLAWTSGGVSEVPWRGWGLRIRPDGSIHPVAAGMRSPAGLGILKNGDLFFAENQGDWIGSGYITHIEEGDFVGHPASLRWANEPESPVQLRIEDIPDTGLPRHVVGRDLPGFKLPSVWFPYTLVGISTADILEDNTNGAFGPFSGQLFVSDQGHSKVMRVFLERVGGEYQGAVFPFRKGFASGTIRLAWGADGSLLVGQTSRGWPATGQETFGLQRVKWSGGVPFEMKTVRAEQDGFVLEFTSPVHLAAPASASAFSVTSFTYRYHSTYGSEIIEMEEHAVRVTSVSPDSASLRLAVEGMRAGYIHEIKVDSTIVSSRGRPLLHNVAYYTLNRIPGGEIAAGSMPAARPQPEARAAGDGPKRTVIRPEDWPARPDHSVTLRTVPGLRFDRESFEVGVGSTVRLTLQNGDDMLHNVVITVVGAADRVGEAAVGLGLRGQELNYVPEMTEVLFHTALVGPGGSESIYFRAPEAAGSYPFICSFPGHYVTMRGVMQVR